MTKNWRKRTLGETSGAPVQPSEGNSLPLLCKRTVPSADSGNARHQQAVEQESAVPDGFQTEEFFIRFVDIIYIYCSFNVLRCADNQRIRELAFSLMSCREKSGNFPQNHEYRFAVCPFIG